MAAAMSAASITAVPQPAPDVEVPAGFVECVHRRRSIERPSTATASRFAAGLGAPCAVHASAGGPADDIGDAAHEISRRSLAGAVLIGDAAAAAESATWVPQYAPPVGGTLPAAAEARDLAVLPTAGVGFGAPDGCSTAIGAGCAMPPPPLRHMLPSPTSPRAASPRKVTSPPESNAAAAACDRGGGLAALASASPIAVEQPPAASPFRSPSPAPSG
eukprot:CAMPEP_0176150006 /NCGR_PEP_ID=MMETSP0120_2-20121206/76561_1 /TAXON_ID=160619 /ORGANISM="Kryptoperidinium foliaceum, Strain CCMP 1326" /LENGTH=216 /DNA_ID=CAMNT_0017486855 /DNA_START=32 /DNA_END=679 /DNA_ORIENTATION=-